jgi:iron complex outermembrane recepter protein
MNKFPRNPMSTAILSALMLSPLSLHPAMAQQGDGAHALEEIIVTARKREEGMQDVPVSVTAFSGAQLEIAGYTELQNLNQSVPNLEFSGGTEVAQIFIRGIGQRDGAAMSDPGVGVYVDGIYISRVDGQMLDTAEISSVQVLRGPQGTLFGKNNVGGAMLIEFAKPSEELGGHLELGAGNLDSKTLNASLDLPLISEKLLTKLSYSSRERDGYIDNITTGDEKSNLDRQSGIAQVRWLIDDDSTLDFLATYSVQDEERYGTNCTYGNDFAAVPFNYSLPQGSGPTAFTDACAESHALLDDDKVTEDSSGEYESKSSLFGITYARNFDRGTFKSVTSYTEQDVTLGEADNDGTSLPFSPAAASDRDAKQFAQEFQFSGLAFNDTLDYTVGAFFQIEDIDEISNGRGRGDGLAAFSGNVSPIPGASFITPSASNFLANEIDTARDNETYAVFAQGSYSFNEWTELTVGGRYTEEKRETEATISNINPIDAFGLIAQGVASGQLLDASNLNPAFPANVIFFSSPNPFSMDGITNFYNDFVADQPYALNSVVTYDEGDTDDDGEYSEFTPMVSLKFSASDSVAQKLGMDDAMSYITYSTGFKSGGFDNIDAGLVPFDPETVTNYEIGFKIDALDRKLRFNGAFFYMDYEDIQIRNAQVFGDTSTVEVIITNAGEANITGAEFELTYQPIASLQILASAGFLDAEFDEFDEVNRATGELVDRSDEDFQEVPDTTFSLALIHTAETDYGRFTTSISGYYRDEIYVGIDDLSWDLRKETTLDSYTVGNARIAWQSPNSSWQVAAWINNFTDEEYYEGRVGVLGLVGGMGATKSPPRTYGLNVRYDF